MKPPCRALRQVAFASDKAMQDFDSFVNQRMQASEAQSPGEALRIGLSLCVLSRFGEALPFLEKAQDSREKFLYLGRVQRTPPQLHRRQARLRQGRQGQGCPPGAVAVEQARRRSPPARRTQADKILQAVAQADRSADWHVAAAKVLEARGQHQRCAVPVYEQALDIDHNQPRGRLPPGVPGRPGGRRRAGPRLYDFLVDTPARSTSMPC